MHSAGTFLGTWARRRSAWSGFEPLFSLLTAASIGWWAITSVSGVPETTQSARLTSGPGVHAAGPELLVGGYMGVPYTLSSDITFRKGDATDLTAHAVNWDGRPFKSPIYYGLRALRWGADGSTGAMVDFLHSKAISQRDQSVQFSGKRDGKPAPPSAKIGETFKHLEFSHGHNMLTLNGMFRLGNIMSWLRPYVGAGGGVALPHTEIQFLDEGFRTYEYQFAGPVGQVMVGFEIKLPISTIFVEYKFTAAWYDVPLTGNDSRGWGVFDLPAQFMAWVRSVKPAHGTARTTLISHQIVMGAAARIGGASLGSP